MNSDPNVRDVVFPIVRLRPDRTYGVVDYDGLQGTAFLIGEGGLAMTAAHVLEGVETQNLLALLVEAKDQWGVYKIEQVATHPSEDVALLRLLGHSGPPDGSFIVPAGSSEHASCHFMAWGYPQDVEHELVIDGIALPRPDLVYFEGYVRRRISGIEIPAIRGEHFYELSEPAGACCSGAPIVKRPTGGGDWALIGVYVGERQSDGVHVGYAAREENFRDWLLPLLAA